MEENSKNNEPLNKDFKVPKLRFPEFKDEWKKIKLSDISTRITEKNKSNRELVPLTISAQNGIINQYDYFDKQIASLNLSNYYILRNGDFAYNKSYSNGYPYGTVKRLDKFEEGALSSLYICFKVINVDSNYLTFYFDSNKWNREVKLISGEGARNHGLLNLSPVDFFNIKLFISSNNKEQIKIAYFLKLLNRKIKLLSLKIQVLKKYKEGLINNLLKPTVVNWKNDMKEGSKLSNFLVPYKQMALNNNVYSHATLSKEGVVPKCERYDRDFLVKNSKKQYRVTHLNDLIYNPANLKFGVICINKLGTVIVSPIYETFKIINIDQILLEAFLTSNTFINFSLKFEEGTVYERKAVSVEDFLNIKICVKNINSQKISLILKAIQTNVLHPSHWTKEQ